MIVINYFLSNPEKNGLFDLVNIYYHLTDNHKDRERERVRAWERARAREQIYQC
mgnify:CR=1 FL=1